ncbi:hypothetical protein D3C80_2146850 [compost metagenome]
MLPVALPLAAEVLRVAAVLYSRLLPISASNACCCETVVLSVAVELRRSLMMAAEMASFEPSAE